MIEYNFSNEYFIRFILEIIKIRSLLEIKDYISIISMIVTAIFSWMLFLNTKKSNRIAEKLYDIEKSNSDRATLDKQIIIEKNAQELYNYLKLTLSDLIENYFISKQNMYINHSIIVYEWSSNISVLKEKLKTKEIDLLYGLYNSVLRLKRIEEDNEQYLKELSRLIELYFEEFLIKKIDLKYHNNHLLYCNLEILRLLDKLYRMYNDINNSRDLYQLNYNDNKIEVVDFSINEPHYPIAEIKYNNDKMIRVEVFAVEVINEKFTSLMKQLKRYSVANEEFDFYSQEINKILKKQCLYFELDDSRTSCYFDNYLLANLSILDDSVENLKILKRCDEAVSFGLIKKNKRYSRKCFETFKIGEFCNENLVNGIKIEYSTESAINYVYYIKDNVLDYYTWTNNEGYEKIKVVFKDDHDIGNGTIQYTNSRLVYKGSIKQGGALSGEGKLFDHEKNQIINGAFENSKIKVGYLENAMFFRKHASFIEEKGVGRFFTNLNTTFNHILGSNNWDYNLRNGFDYSYTGKVNDFMFNDESCIISLENMVIYQGPIVNGEPVNIECFLDSYESILCEMKIIDGFDEGKLKEVFISEFKFVN